MQQTEVLTEKTILKEIPVSEKLIHRWGSAISEIILDTACKFFSIPEVEGFIGYREVNQCAVVLGEPICVEKNKHKLASAFQKFCVENGLNCIYFIVSKPFAKWAAENICNVMIEIGEEMIFDPFTDSLEGHKNVKLRNKISHAQNLGLSVKEYIPFNTEIEKSILEVGKEWVQARRGPQIYLGNLNFFAHRADRRWFYLQDQEQKILGMALLTRTEAHQGWLLKFLITVPNVPRGASELLMINILQTLQNEGCRYLTYGMVPADHLGELQGLNPFASWIAKRGFTAAKWLFHLDQRKTYWQKFHPKMEPAYLLFSNPGIGIKELRALISTMKMDF